MTAAERAQLRALRAQVRALEARLSRSRRQYAQARRVLRRALVQDLTRAAPGAGREYDLAGLQAAYGRRLEAAPDDVLLSTRAQWQYEAHSGRRAHSRQQAPRWWGVVRRVLRVT